MEVHEQVHPKAPNIDFSAAGAQSGAGQAFSGASPDDEQSQHEYAVVQSAAEQCGIEQMPGALGDVGSVRQ
jgi:hypothetical protein